MIQWCPELHRLSIEMDQELPYFLFYMYNHNYFPKSSLIYQSFSKNFQECNWFRGWHVLSNFGWHLLEQVSGLFERSDPHVLFENLWVYNLEKRLLKG